MNQVQVISFNNLIAQAQADAVKQAGKYGVYGKDPDYNFIDIDKFIKVLYTLLDINKLLLNSERIDGIDADTSIDVNEASSRFYFSEEYPDQKTYDRDIVSFEIRKRAPSSLAANADPFEGYKNWRPMYRGLKDNKIDGSKEAIFMTQMDNRIRFTVWSTKVKQAHSIARLLETFMTKYYWFLRQFVPVIVFEGQINESRVTDGYGDLRYYPIYLDYFIRTNELYSLSENDVKNIEVNVNAIRTIIQDCDKETIN